MRRLVLLVALAACGDNIKASTPGDGSLPTPDAAVTPLGPCLERPTDLPRPPTGPLPCELLPPGFQAKRGGG